MYWLMVILVWSVWGRGWRVKWFLVLLALAVKVPSKRWGFWHRCAARPGSTRTRLVCRASWPSTTPACPLWPSSSCWTPLTPTPTSIGRTLRWCSTSLISVLIPRAPNTPAHKHSVIRTGHRQIWTTVTYKICKYPALASGRKDTGLIWICKYVSFYWFPTEKLAFRVDWIWKDEH